MAICHAVLHRFDSDESAAARARVDDHRLRPCFRQLVREQPHKRRGRRTGRVGRGDLDHFRWKRLSDGNLGRGDEADCRNDDEPKERSVAHSRLRTNYSTTEAYRAGASGSCDGVCNASGAVRPTRDEPRSQSDMNAGSYHDLFKSNRERPGLCISADTAGVDDAARVDNAAVVAPPRTVSDTLSPRRRPGPICVSASSDALRIHQKASTNACAIDGNASTQDTLWPHC